MHPMKPQLNGKSLSAVKDPTGKALFVEMVSVAKTSGAGFVHYMWPKPGSDVDVEKVSYVQMFQPWGWITGSGVYIDDVDALVWQRIRASLRCRLIANISATGFQFSIGRFDFSIIIGTISLWPQPISPMRPALLHPPK